VQKELDSMVKIGNQREAKLKKGNQALTDLMAKNKADTASKMEKMSKQFYMQLNKIRDQMAKDRKHNEKRLGKATTALFNTLKANQEHQEKINKELTAATRRAALDAQQQLQTALARTLQGPKLEARRSSPRPRKTSS